MADKPGTQGPKGGDGSSVTSDLASRIARARADRPGEQAEREAQRGDMSGVGRAFRLASEFIAAIAVGAGIGWTIDWVFKTSPWGVVVLLLLGFAAGVLNVVRAAAEMNAAAAVPPGTPALRDEDDE